MLGRRPVRRTDATLEQQLLVGDDHVAVVSVAERPRLAAHVVETVDERGELVGARAAVPSGDRGVERLGRGRADGGPQLHVC